MTLTAVSSGHYDGGANLNEGSRSAPDAVLLEETLNANITQVNADGVNIATLQAYVAGLKDPKDSCRGASAAALGACTAAGSGVGKTLTQNVAAVEAIDGLTPVVGERFLIKDQVATEDNGIYTITVVGTVLVQQVLTRATDADTDAEMTTGVNCHVSEGTANADTHWSLTTNDPITLDTTGLTFAEIVPVEHASSHERGGADEIDGDHLDIDFTPSGYVPSTTPAEAASVDDLAAHLAGIDDEVVDAVHDEGSAAVVVLIQAGVPTASDTLTVGADSYVADTDFVIGTAEVTLDNLLADAVANGTENLFWDKLDATHLRIRSADAPQGNIIGADPDIALVNGLSNWSTDVGDVNMNTLAGKALSKRPMSAVPITISAAMITAGAVRVAFPFTPNVIQVMPVTSAGVHRNTQNDNFTISGDDVLITLAVGGAPDIQNTDVVHVIAYG